MKRITQFLARTDLPALSYVWKAALIAFIPSLLIGKVVDLALPDYTPSFNEPVVSELFGALLFSPWTETLFMWPILWILKKFIRNQLTVAISSAVVWAILHSLGAPAWGLGVAWPFFIFSLCFLAWEKKSIGKAIVVTALLHTCQNLLAEIAGWAGL